MSELIPQSNFACVQSLCQLYEAIHNNKANLLNRAEDPEGYWSYAEKWFTYAVIWSLCVSADERGRAKIDIFIREIEAQFPHSQTVFDYYIEPKVKDWKLWEDKIQASWKPPKDAEFHTIVVPTVDTLRATACMTTLLHIKRAIMVVGNTGTGKTVLIQKTLNSLPETHSQLPIYFSSASTSMTTQHIIEGVMEKRSKDKFGPSGGKQLVTFVDDFNMPQKDEFGSQPPLELLRQWIDYGGWYEREKQTWRNILDMQIVAAMGPPGGGRSVISQRLQSRFHLLNLTFPANKQLLRIFQLILQPKLSEFDEEIKTLPQGLAQGVINVYLKVVEDFLPTPAKCHYLFNMRDIAKVVQGLLMADKHFYDSKQMFLRLWTHECQRVISDRFLDQPDLDRFRSIVDGQLAEQFQESWEGIMDDLPKDEIKQGPIFCDFLSEPVGDSLPPYEEVTDRVKLKSYLEDMLEDYNSELGFVAMHLVLFKDAIRHICRIARVLKQPRGNAMLIGVGGSGRQSLTRLSSYVCGYKVFMIEITKNYRSLEFHEDLKILYNQAGVDAVPTTFLFNDTQLKEESFLEDINNILSSGEVPNLYAKDEIPAILDGVRKAAKKANVVETADKLWDFFISQVRKNLHVVLCMSNVGDGFRNRCRMYPGLVSCTTMDYFFPWPAEALQEVALKFLDDVKTSAGSLSEEVQLKLAKSFARAHQDVTDASARMLLRDKRHNYVTPTSFLELVKSYKQIYVEKDKEIAGNARKLIKGLDKLQGAKEQVEELKIELAATKITVQESQKNCENLLVVIVSERRVADEQQKQVETDSERIGKEAVVCERIAADAEEDLNVALPALNNALKEVDKLEKKDITEIKHFSTPPPLVVTVLSAVMLLFGKKGDWKTAKLKIGESDFLKQVKTYNKDNVSKSVLTKLKKFTARDDFNYESVKKVSTAASALCVWVCAMEIYSNVFREVAPKRAKLKAAMDSLATAEEGLAEAKAK